jgi:hypothetical protein
MLAYPTVLTIVHLDGTSILSLYNRRARTQSISSLKYKDLKLREEEKAREYR